MLALTAARRYAAAVNRLSGNDKARVWNARECSQYGYPRARAGVVMEETGFGAFTKSEILTESGFGKWVPIDTEIDDTVLVEPYASWLMLFYSN